MPSVALRAALCAALLATGLAAPRPAGAQTVSLGGSLGDKAVLIIDGKPRTVASGASVQGVKLVGVTGGSAVIEVKGKQRTLALGGAQVNLGGTPSAGGGTQIVMAAGSGGHFFSSGTINGKSVQFMVDTGATYVSMGAAEAERLGVNFRNGRRGISSTANGPMPVYLVSLASLRVGDVQLYNVEALVSQMPMELVLLGNSFLTRFQMRRDNDTMTLSLRQ